MFSAPQKSFQTDYLGFRQVQVFPGVRGILVFQRRFGTGWVNFIRSLVGQFYTIVDSLALLQRQVFDSAAAQEVAQRQAILGQGLKGRLV